MFRYPDIPSEILEIAKEKEAQLKPVFADIEDICAANQYKVLSAFQKARIAQEDFQSGSGYGYNEPGREKLEQVFAEVFHTEDALVRPHITCGTHALYLAVSSTLLPGDEILFITGKPYDSLEKSIGITDSPLSLKEFGISHRIVPLLEDGSVHLEAIPDAINQKTKVVYLQRSRGYTTRPSLTISQISEAISVVRSVRKDVVIIVDNCYGEFTDIQEPSDVGADLCVGSLIKNPGGGLAPMGGYIVGKADLIERCAFRLTAPGLGKEVGASSGTLLPMYQGLAMAPKTVAEAMKNAYFATAMYEHFGYVCHPRLADPRGCIVVAIDLKDPETLSAFCEEIQASSYVDSFVRPEAWDMPGYQDQVIMASGSFIAGSSIELSADGPLREPYTVFLQGGLTYEQGQYAILRTLGRIRPNR